MKIFLDFEFMEDGRTIEPISIGLVAEGRVEIGREYYAEFAGADLAKANPFVREHVIPKLKGGDAVKTLGEIRGDILGFVGVSKPEFWGYYADYDWVAFCQIFGKMIDLPKDWPMYCRDLKQFAVDLGNPKLLTGGKNEHNALADARWNAKTWGFLDALRQAREDETRWKGLVRAVVFKDKGSGNYGITANPAALEALYKLVHL